MKYSRKRKFNSQDIRHVKTNEPLKKFKINGLTYECHSPINWHEVTIILDATVVEKYLNNKKGNSEILTTPLNNTRTLRRDENVVPHVPQSDKMFGSVFSKINDVMVKLEISEDIRYDNSVENENFEFANVPFKQEENAINGDEFEESMCDDFQCQNYQNHPLFTEQLVDEVSKNEKTVSDSCHEELTIGSEFKHEELLPNYENLELISQRNNNARKEISSQRITHKNRKKKKVAKKNLISKRVNKNIIEDSNNSIKSRTLSKANPRKTPVNPQSRRKRKQLYECNDCHKTYSQKQFLSKHITNVHLQSSQTDLISCTKCNKNFKSMKFLETHRCFCLFQTFLKCKYCLLPINSKTEMKIHLDTAHMDIFPERIKYSILDEFWIKSLKDVFTELEREGNTKKLACFATKFLQEKKYWSQKKYLFFKFYCKYCRITYETHIQYCSCCKSQLLYQCRNCKTIRSNYNAMYRHLQGMRTRHDISENDPLETDEERSKATNESATSDKPCKKYYKCRMCEYKWTTKSQLYKHIFKHMDENINYFTCSKCGREFRSICGKQRFNKHEELCGISVRYPCIFCPRTLKSLVNLAKHLSRQCKTEMNDMTTEDILKYATTFKNMITTINNARFNEKFKIETVKGEAITDSNYYLNGIQNMVKPICLKCNATVTQPYDICLECRTTLIYQCLQCGKQFSKYFHAWKHVTGTCENRILTLPLNGTSNNEADIENPTQSNELSYFLEHSYPRQSNEPSYLLEHSYALKM